MSKSLNAWLLFIVLTIIWGSSFILMKIGMQSLSPYQVATIRIVSAGIVLLPFAWKAFKNVDKKKIPNIILSGLLGSFFPAYFYCVAESRIDSSLAAILNSLTPLCAILVGISFFQLRTTSKKIVGVVIGFLGLVLLPFATQKGIDFKDLSYSLLVIAATVCYGLNVNMVNRYLKDTASLHIASLAFCFLLLPSLGILIYTGYFSLPLFTAPYLKASFAAATLGVMGTAIASILFYMLVKKAGVLFASLVTYGIPVIAVVLGLFYGEVITLAEIGCLAVILGGVYLVNR